MVRIQIVASASQDHTSACMLPRQAWLFELSSQFSALGFITTNCTDEETKALRCYVAGYWLFRELSHRNHTKEPPDSLSSALSIPGLIWKRWGWENVAMFTYIPLLWSSMQSDHFQGEWIPQSFPGQFWDTELYRTAEPGDPAKGAILHSTFIHDRHPICYKSGCLQETGSTFTLGDLRRV